MEGGLFLNRKGFQAQPTFPLVSEVLFSSLGLPVFLLTSPAFLVWVAFSDAGGWLHLCRVYSALNIWVSNFFSHYWFLPFPCLHPGTSSTLSGLSPPIFLICTMLCAFDSWNTNFFVVLSTLFLSYPIHNPSLYSRNSQPSFNLEPLGELLKVLLEIYPEDSPIAEPREALFVITEVWRQLTSSSLGCCWINYGTYPHHTAGEKRGTISVLGWTQGWAV